MTVGAIGAIMFGFMFFVYAVFDAGNSLAFRIFFGLLAVIGFLGGYFEREEKKEVAD